MLCIIHRSSFIVLLVLCWPVVAEARGWRRASRPVSYYSYYPPAVVVVPVPAVYPPVCVPIAAAPPRIYATPTPAPPLAPAAPGAPPMPPATAPPPAVQESRSYFDAYALAGQDGKPLDGWRCSVGFWNHSDRDLVLSVDGQARTLPRGKGINLDLPRTFVWQVDGREPQTERVPTDHSGVEIVIRR